MLGVESRGQRILSLGQEEAAGRAEETAHSPSVAERRVLGLEVRGLQEDIQGFLELTQLKQALALRRGDCQFRYNASSAELCGQQRTGREAWTETETSRDRDGEMQS